MTKKLKKAKEVVVGPYLKTIPEMTIDEVILERAFSERWVGKPFIIINNDTDCTTEEGEKFFDKHKKNVCQCGDLLYLLSPSTMIWWRIFWDQVERIGVKNITAITGRAGTGKTTWLLEFLKSQKVHPKNAFICAPTGVACANLRKALVSLGHDFEKRVTTPHSAFKMSRKDAAGRSSFSGLPVWALKHKFKTKEGRIYILDEAANADLRTVCLMMMMIPTGSVLLLLGDTDQLPPVGYGAPMAALLKSGLNINKLNLTKVHRVSPGSVGLLQAQGAILDDGEWPEDGMGFSTEIKADMKEAEARVLALMQDGYQVLASTNALALRFGAMHSKHRHAFLTNKLDYRNKIDEEETYLRKGDMVRILVSDHIRGVYNGQIAEYVKYLEASKTHVVLPHDSNRGVSNSGTVRIQCPAGTWKTPETSDELKGDGGFSQEFLDSLQTENTMEGCKGLLMHAESLTIHRAQGSEWDKVCVVVPWPSRMLNRNLAYVAITRAKKSCIVIFMDSPTLGRTAVEAAKLQMLRPADEILFAERNETTTVTEQN